MDALRFEMDELSSLREWPVFLNDDWSLWTEAPCAILFGETQNCCLDAECLSRVEKLLCYRSPTVTAFQVRKRGLLVLSTDCSRPNARLLAENVSQTLHQSLLMGSRHNETVLTWGITLTQNHDWSLSRALQAVVAPVERAFSEKRYGSINEVIAEWPPSPHDGFWICSRRDSLTNLKLWDHTVAICSHYRDEPVAMLLGELVNPTIFNDVYGQGMGDVLLQMLAHVLRRFESNEVATFCVESGKFLVWVRGRSQERARQLAEQINAQIGELQIPVPGADIPINNVSLTWAVVAASPRDLGLNSLMKKARMLLDDTKLECPGSVSAQHL